MIVLATIYMIGERSPDEEEEEERHTYNCKAFELCLSKIKKNVQKLDVVLLSSDLYFEQSTENVPMVRVRDQARLPPRLII